MTDRNDEFRPTGPAPGQGAEREAIAWLRREAEPPDGLEERIIGALRTRGLLKAPETERGRVRRMLTALVPPRPALAALGVAGAFALGFFIAPRNTGHDLTRTISELDPVAVRHEIDAVGRYLLVGKEDPRYELYADREGAYYYVLLRVPAREQASSVTDEPAPGVVAASIPGGFASEPHSNGLYDFYYAPDGTPLGVMARNATAGLLASY